VKTPFVNGHTSFGCARVALRVEQDHWLSATLEFSEKPGQAAELMDDEEKALAARPDANMPALLTKDVRGG
jgi:hypothetical protein